MFYLHFTKNSEFEFSSAGKFVARNKQIHPRRNLKSAVLLVGSDGECPIEQDGRSYVLKKGDFLILFPDIEHGGTAPVSHMQSHFWCHFYLPEACVISGNAGDAESLVVPEYGHLIDAKAVNILFRQLIDASRRIYSCKNAYTALCDSYIKILLTTLADEFSQNTIENDILPQKAVISKISEWIRFHCLENITVRDVAVQFHYNADYLTHIFKRHTGYCVCGYINLMRINEAKSLLLNSDMKIAEIARFCGFSDEKYFMKQFKKFESVTPTQYRQSYFRMHFN